MDDRRAFATLIDAVRPWLNELVIIGGWAHQLHHLLPGVTLGSHAVLRTRDADIAFTHDSAIQGNIDDALRAAGFRVEITGDDTPPITQYTLGEDEQGFYVEFLAPLTGSPVDRDGRPRTTLARGGVTAQTLRHVELLLLDPSLVHLGAGSGFQFDQSTAVRIANPASFLAQKLLIHGKRRREKRAQDILYVFDTVQLFGARLGRLNELWTQELRPRVTGSLIAEIGASITDLFGTVTDDIRSAVRIPADRRIEPEELRAACFTGLARVFNDALDQDD